MDNPVFRSTLFVWAAAESPPKAVKARHRIIFVWCGIPELQIMAFPVVISRRPHRGTWKKEGRAGMLWIILARMEKSMMYPPIFIKSKAEAEISSSSCSEKAASGTEECPEEACREKLPRKRGVRR